MADALAWMSAARVRRSDVREEPVVWRAVVKACRAWAWIWACEAVGGGGWGVVVVVVEEVRGMAVEEMEDEEKGGDVVDDMVSMYVCMECFVGS